MAIVPASRASASTGSALAGGVGERCARGSSCARCRSRSGAPSAASSSEAAQQLEVVRDRLAEADPGVEHDPLARDARAPRRSSRRSARNALTSSTTSLVARLARCIVRGSPSMCIRQQSAPLSATTLGHLGVGAQRAHVVDEARARLERRARDRGLGGVDRDLHARAAAAASPSITGQHPAQLLLAPAPARRPGRVDSPPTSRISAPSRDQLRRVRDRRVRVRNARRRRTSRASR